MFRVAEYIYIYIYKHRTPLGCKYMWVLLNHFTRQAPLFFRLASFGPIENACLRKRVAQFRSLDFTPTYGEAMHRNIAIEASV